MKTNNLIEIIIRKIILQALIIFSICLTANAQELNNAVRIEDTGDIKLRRYADGDNVWKRALVPFPEELRINYQGDFQGTRIMGEHVTLDGFLWVSPHDNMTGEGGKVGLLGATGYRDWHIDNHRGAFRLIQNGKVYFRIQPTGEVKIAAPDTDDHNALEVCGVGRFEEVLVEDGWCDYVFEPDYCLTTLEEEEEFIKLYGHLSNFESAKAMNGEINVNDIFKRQQIQIEENVLHLIELNDENKVLQIQVNDLTDNVEQLTTEVATLSINYEALAKELAYLKAQLK